MAETTTISNLPQITIDELTNDTLVPVENVDGTKAANLAQLRKKLNSLYVEMVDADLNELKQDGIYECCGTTLNAPTSEVAAWIIQTAEHEGVVVQNAFGFGTTSYSYVYRRRWNGVSWTAWENKIQTLETVKANAANTVTTDTAQTITAPKVFNTELVRKSTVIDVTTQPENYTPNNAFKFIDKNGKVMGYLENSKHVDGKVATALHARNKDNYQQSIGVFVPQSGTTGAYAAAPTPPVNSAGGEIVTAEWFRRSGCVVRTVIETYKNGTNWYRIWSDGWKEQGGFSPNGAYIVNFLKTFTDASYTALCTFMDGYSSNSLAINSRTTTGFEINRGTYATDIGNKAWYACGY